MSAGGPRETEGRGVPQTPAWSPLFDLLPHGLALLDQDGRLLGANPAAADLLDLPLDGEAPWAEALRSGAAARGRLVRTTRKGHEAWLEITAEPLPAGGVLVTLDDVTRSRAHARDAERMTELYAGLSQINQAIVWSPDPEALHHQVCEALVVHGRFRMAFIYHADTGLQELRRIACAGEPQELARDMSLRPGGPPNHSLVMEAFRTGRTQVNNDMAATMEGRPLREGLVRAGVAASAALPILRNGAPWGVLGVFAAEAGFFGKAEVDLLEEAVGDLAFGLDRFDLAARKAEAERKLKVKEWSIEASQAAMANVDLEGRFIYANPAFLRMWGFPDREAVLGRPAFGMWADPEAAAGILASVLKGNGWSGERVGLRADGTRFDVLMSANRVLNEAGEPECVQASFLDITERLRQERVLKESEEKFALLFHKSPAMLALSDAETGRFLDLNEAFQSGTGFTREDFLGRTSVEVGWLAAEARSELLRELQRKGHLDDQILTLTSKAGAALTCVCRVQELTLGPQRCFLSSFQDITEHVRSEAGLRAYQARLEAALASMADAVFITDLAGGLVEFNEAFAAFHRFPDKASCVRNLEAYVSMLELRTPDGGLVPAGDWPIARALRGGTGSAEEFLLRRLDTGDAWPGSLSYSPIRGRDGAIQGAVLVARDITHQKRAEAERAQLQSQLLNAQKMDSLGHLAGGVAHDMNNVLAAILALSSANLAMEAEDSFARRAFETINKAAIRGGEMARRLLAFARRNPAQEREVDLNGLLREVVGLLERTTLAKVRLELSLDEALPAILGDPGALSHAIMNLCVNAVDALSENGALILGTRVTPGGQVEVRVEDNGSGMPREVLDRALDPYFTTKPEGKGTGLGLSMVYSCAKAHRGDMEIRSEVGRGTCVLLRFPPSRAREAGAEGAREAEPGPGGPALDVLVVDDDKLIQDSLGMLLEVMGHHPAVANEGEEALARLEAGYRPHVVILDMSMPGLGGPATLRQLKALVPDLPVLLSTGHEDQASLDLAAAYPGVTLLPKPFTLEALNDCLRTASRRVVTPQA